MFNNNNPFINALKRSQPQNWLVPFRSATPNLAPDETLSAVLHFQIKNLKKNEVMQSMFIVVKKGDKAIARSVFCHGATDACCTGHADDFAEYPIANLENLVNEARDHALMIAAEIANGASPNMEMGNGPAFYLQAPSFATNRDIAKKLIEERDPQGEDAKAVIMGILGLIPEIEPEPAIPQETMVRMEAEKNQALSAATQLERAAKETELIKKYGKKAMLELAKKMNYNGEVINKTKNKAHAN